jgi:hypothetical protein
MKAIAIVAMLALLVPVAGSAQVQVTTDPATMTNGFMNVFNLPAPDGDGAFQFASPWGFADLRASFDGTDLTFAPNTINDPDPFWYIGGGGPGAPGNKIMEANGYAEVLDGSLAGETIVFTFEVLSNTLTDAHTVTAFIRDFAPDFSTVNETVIPVDAIGAYSLSLDTINDPARPVQWGIQMRGVNVWETDVEPFGEIVIGADLVVSTDESSFAKVKALYQQ